jgi:hypothetical protein
MERRQRLSDEQAHERALRHLVTCLGADCSAEVCWDPDHHLQGHVDVDGRHLVLIAPRDDVHDPRLLVEADWEALRRGRPTLV